MVRVFPAPDRPRRMPHSVYCKRLLFSGQLHASAAFVIASRKYVGHQKMILIPIFLRVLAQNRLSRFRANDQREECSSLVRSLTDSISLFHLASERDAEPKMSLSISVYCSVKSSCSKVMAFVKTHSLSAAFCIAANASRSSFLFPAQRDRRPL